tara:strand:- start:2555 stop:3523 length:969 start_codon:yes stop_codon:yes gene_type:complete
MNKFEQLIEYIINDEEEKARNLFHEVVVEKSRDIYENLLADEEKATVEAETADKVEETLDETSADTEEVDEAPGDMKKKKMEAPGDMKKKKMEATDEAVDAIDSDEDAGGDAADDLVDEIEADEEGMALEGEHDEEEKSEDLEDRVVDLEDKLDELMDEFEDFMKDEKGEEEPMEPEMEPEMPEMEGEEPEVEGMHPMKKKKMGMEDAVEEAKDEESVEETAESKDEGDKEVVAEKADLKPAKADHSDGTDPKGKASPTSKKGGAAMGTTKSHPMGKGEESQPPMPATKDMNMDSKPNPKPAKAVHSDGTDPKGKSSPMKSV